MRGFGSLTQISSDRLSWSGGDATATIELPEDTDLLLLGICTLGETGEHGQTNVVRSFKYRDIERIRGDADALVDTKFHTGVPLRDIAGLGTNQPKAWPGSYDALAGLVDMAAQGEAPHLGKGARELKACALQTLRTWTGDLAPARAGILVHGDSLTIKLSSLDSDDTPEFVTLYALVLGRKSRLPAHVAQWNAPFWLAQTPLALSAAAVQSAVRTQQLALPAQSLGSAEHLYDLETMASVFVDADGTYTAAEGVELFVEFDTQSSGADPLWGATPLGSLAVGGGNPMFRRTVRDEMRLGYKITGDIVSAAAELYLTDYLLLLPREYAWPDCD